MVRLFLLTISISAVALGVVFEDPSALNLEENSTLPQTDPASQFEENLRFGGSPGLFFLNLLKHKLNKLQHLEKIPTTPTSLPNCICVPYYLCDNNNNIILDGLGPLDIRYRPCTGNQEVCCYLRIQTTKPPTMPTTTRPKTPPILPTKTRTTTPLTMPTTPTTPPTIPTTLPTTRPTMPTTTRPTTRPTMTTTRITTPPTMPTTTRPTTPMTSPTTIPTIFPPTNCFCVFTWQCDTNGFIIVDGSGMINPRQINSVCPLPNQVCCRVNPYIQPSYPSIDPRPYTTVPTILPTLPPVQTTFPTFLPGQTTCMCMLIVQCNVFGYIPINEAGKIDPRYTMGQMRQMGSPCSNTQEMCCRMVYSVATSQVLPTNANLGSQEVKYPGTPNACICVKSWNCPEKNVVYPEGFGIIDPRFGACPVENEVCCRLNAVLPPTNTAENIFTTMRTTMPSVFPQNVCGIISKTFAPAQPISVASGRTYFAEFPWMVVLLLRYPGQNDAFLCGASLINSRTILTAGHCVQDREISNLVARFGEWDTNTTSEPLPFQEARIETVITHPQYYNAALYHDVAILILKTPVACSANVMPICLPQQGQVFAPGTRCYATGWGRSAFGSEGQYQTILRKIDLPLIEHGDCQNRLRQSRLGQYFQLHGSFVCAGGEESKDTCRGDGGGPLVCPISTGQYVQVGIVSWGIGCGSSNPAVYASVTQHRLWIDQQLAKYGVL